VTLVSSPNDTLPLEKIIEITEKIVISSVYQHQPDAIKNWRWSMKVSNAVNLFLDYHKMNSQKKYDQGLRIHLGQIQGLFS
jgi:hypothetical protein